MVAPEVVGVVVTERETIGEVTERLGLPALVRAVEVLGRAQAGMRDALDPRVSLEVALVRLAHPEADESPEAMLVRIEHLPNGGGEPPVRPMPLRERPPPPVTPPPRSSPPTFPLRGAASARKTLELYARSPVAYPRAGVCPLAGVPQVASEPIPEAPTPPLANQPAPAAAGPVSAAGFPTARPTGPSLGRSHPWAVTAQGQSSLPSREIRRRGEWQGGLRTAQRDPSPTVRGHSGGYRAGSLRVLRATGGAVAGGRERCS